MVIRKILVVSGSGVQRYEIQEDGVAEILDKSNDKDLIFEVVNKSGKTMAEIINCPVIVCY